MLIVYAAAGHVMMTGRDMVNGTHCIILATCWLRSRYSTKKVKYAEESLSEPEIEGN